MNKPTDTIESREPRYGDYYERAELKERIIEAFAEGRNWMGLEPDARNSLLMIADKVSRVLNGDPDDPDSWHDIGGYSKLVERRLEFESSPQSDPDGRSDDEPQTRCPYFTGEPPSWDDIDGDWLVQDYDGEFRSYPVRPEPAEECFWWSSNRFALQCEDELGAGPRNPNWKLAIEPRPETHQ